MEEHPNIAAIRRELEADGPPRKWHELSHAERQRIRERHRMDGVPTGYVRMYFDPGPVRRPPVEDASGRAATRRRAQAARATAKAHRL